MAQPRRFRLKSNRQLVSFVTRFTHGGNRLVNERLVYTKLG